MPVNTTIITTTPEPEASGVLVFAYRCVYPLSVMTEPDILRYPAGRFQPPAASTADTRAAQIETLRLLPERLRAAVTGLSKAQLDTPYREGGWTVRQVVHHLADSHANSVIRFKLALTEDWPTVKPYDEAAWARLPDSSALAIDGSLVFLDALHARWVALLASLAEADFERGYMHPENGRQTLAYALALYAWHSRHHTAHITSLREREGW
jgi:uncharacterized damage-inducible protein DinB